MAALAALAGCGTRGIGPSGAGPTERTFNAPVARVRMASISAMSRMGIRHIGGEKVKEGEVLKGVTPQRKIEITLEPLSPTATRVKVTAREGTSLSNDSATATEILVQTGRVLGQG